MRRRDFIALLGGTAILTLAGALARAAQAARVYRIGILETVPVERNRANLDALIQGLRDLGYTQGQNLEIVYRSADGQGDRFPALASDLVGLGIDLIVTRGTPAAKAAKGASSTIPVVMAAIGEPLGVGVVSSLAHPGGNVTGFSSYVAELAGKRVELLKETFPSITCVGFLQNMANPVSPSQWEATQKTAKALGLAADLLDVRTDKDIADAFAAVAARRIDALSVGIDALTQADAPAIVRLAAQHRLPTAYPAREFVDAGGVMSYGPSYPDLYRRSAVLIDRIFKGARPGDLPVEVADKLELVVNLKAAKALALDIPPALLARADEVIE